MSLTTEFRSSTSGCTTVRRLNVSSWRVSVAPFLATRVISSTSSRERHERLVTFETATLHLVREALGHEAGVVHDPGQQVVEVVGDPARELADALEPLRLLELGLEERSFLVALGVDEDRLSVVLFLLDSLALGDVTDDRRHENAVVRRGWRQRDVDREFAAVLAPP